MMTEIFGAFNVPSVNAKFNENKILNQYFMHQWFGLKTTQVTEQNDVFLH